MFIIVHILGTYAYYNKGYGPNYTQMDIIRRELWNMRVELSGDTRQLESLRSRRAKAQHLETVLGKSIEIMSKAQNPAFFSTYKLFEL